MPTPTTSRKLIKFPPFALKKSHQLGYQEIHVLFLSWQADDIGVSAQLDLLSRVFSSVYNATSIASCLIPSEDSEEFVRGVVAGFLERWDGVCETGFEGVCVGDLGRGLGVGGEGGERKLRKKRRKDGKVKSVKAAETKKLLLIYYSGHGEVSKKEGGGLDWKKPFDELDPPSLPWTPIQKSLEFTQSDILLILDSCSSASSISFSPSPLTSQIQQSDHRKLPSHHPSQRSTFTLLTSCCFSTQTPGLGPDSFFNFFVQELCSLPLVKKSMREGGFEIEELHRRLVARAGRGGEGARCPVLVRISSSYGERGGGSAKGIVLGRLEDEKTVRETMVENYLVSAREILGFLEERFSKGDEDELEGHGMKELAESARDGCEGARRDSVDCCEVTDCQVVNCESEATSVDQSGSRRVSGSGVIRLDSSESEDTLGPLVRC
ncbi:hypothetical protein HYALB_00001675 [Hymenoscyphus albidus]|uniref:Uncharacterized protein n=1 Tax=Hymenoscyphus albidus TaxID=595503 RepID=A0A9N9LGQ7_9HELO|nr:hypothetical protein HYALB_00001675 [Hymenoscyphus albidus]